MADYAFSADYFIQNEQANRGPFYDSTSGDYYVLLQSQDSTWDVEMWRSTDDGDTYSEQDASNAPTPGGASQSQYGNGATGVYVSGTRRIYVFYWVMTSSVEFTLRATYFNIATNAWHTSTWDSSQACHTDAATNAKTIDVEYRTTTDIGVYYMGQDEKVMGSPYERMNFEVFNPSTNAWAGSAVEVENGIGYDIRGGGFTYDNSGDVICTASYYAASGSRQHIYKIVSGTDTDHGVTGNTAPFSNEHSQISSVYSGLSTEEFAMAYRSSAATDVLRYDYSTSPTTTPWTSTSVDSDNAWAETGDTGASICFVGTKRYLFAYKDGTTNTEVHCWTKDGAGSWTEVGMIYEHSTSAATRQLRVNHLKTDTNEFFGFVFDPVLNYDQTVAVIWEEGGAITRTKTASVDAKLVPPEGVLPNITMPDVVLGDGHVKRISTLPGNIFVIYGVAKDNAKELILLANFHHGRDNEWTEVKSLHTFANDIKSLHVNSDNNSEVSVTVQLDNGDVYWGVHYPKQIAGTYDNEWDWRRDTHQWANGSYLTPRLVASPGTPDDFGAIAVGDFHDSSGNEPRAWIFYHKKVSTTNKIMWRASKHDEDNGEYNSVGGYWTGEQRLDPDSTDDEYLGIGMYRKPELGWSVSDTPQILYTREGASATRLIKRQVWPAVYFDMYTDATGGTFDLTWNDHWQSTNNIQTITSINYNSTAATIKSKLEGATNVTTVTVTGAGTKANPWHVQFTSYRASGIPNECVAYFEPDSSNLTGGTAYVAVPTTEVDITAVKHQSRVRSLRAYYNGSTPGPDDHQRYYVPAIGTDNEPLITQSEQSIDYDWNYGTVENWPWEVQESGIGTHNVAQDTNGYPMLFYESALANGQDNDRVWHRIILMVDDTSDDLKLYQAIDRDTDVTDPTLAWSPTSVQGWTVEATYTRTGTDENPVHFHGFDINHVIGEMEWIEEVGTNLKWFWRRPHLPPDDLQSKETDYGWEWNPLVADETYDAPDSDYATWSAQALGIEYSGGSFRSVFMDSNGDLHKFTFRGDHKTIAHQFLDSADVGDGETAFEWTAWKATHQTWSTTAQYIVAFDMVQDGDTVHLVTLEKNHDGSSADVWRYYYYKGSLTSQSWSVTAETVNTISQPSGQTGMPRESTGMDWPRIALRSDDYIAVLHIGTPSIRTGSTYAHNLAVSVRNTSGTWTLYDSWRTSGDKAVWSGPASLVYGASDRLHVYWDEYNYGTSQYDKIHQSMTTTGTKDTATVYTSLTSTPHSVVRGQALAFDASGWKCQYFYERITSGKIQVYVIEHASSANPTISADTFINSDDGDSDYATLIYDEAGENIGVWDVARIGNNSYLVGMVDDLYTTSFYFYGMWVWWQGTYQGDWSIPKWLYRNVKAAADGGDVTGTDDHETWPLQHTIDNGAVLGVGAWTRSSTDYLWVNLSSVDYNHRDLIQFEAPTTPAIIKDHTFDAIIKALGTEVDHTFDAILESATEVAIDHTFDAIVMEESQLDHTFDAHVIIKGEEDHTFDAIISQKVVLAADMDITINATPTATEDRTEIIGLGVIGAGRPGGTTGPDQNLSPFGIKVYRPVRRIIREEGKDE